MNIKSTINKITDNILFLLNDSIFCKLYYSNILLNPNEIFLNKNYKKNLQRNLFLSKANSHL